MSSARTVCVTENQLNLDLALFNKNKILLKQGYGLDEFAEISSRPYKTIAMWKT